MADFSGFTDTELSGMYEVFQPIMDQMHHYPDEVSPDIQEVVSQLYADFWKAAKDNAVWWARI